MRLCAIFLLLSVIARSSLLANDVPLGPPHDGQVLPAGNKTTNPPTIDGVINEAEWKNAASLQGLVNQHTGAPAPYPAQFWVTYDERYIYVAGKITNKNANKIPVNEYRTNVNLDGEERIAFWIDPLGVGGEEAFNVFRVSPRGATQVIIAGGRAVKREWLGEFNAKARVTAEGWECEARIPWGIMRLPVAGRHRVRLNFAHAVLEFNDTFKAVVAANHPERLLQWDNVDVPAANQPTIKLLPYTFLGYSKDNGIMSNSGIDVRTPISGTLDYVGSLNPDFRNVEQGVLDLQFSYFARLAKETRPFFLEGASYFQTAVDAPLFTSQRISRFDMGNKIAGKLDAKTELGVFNAINYGDESDIVVNYKHHIDNNTDYQFAYAGQNLTGFHNQGAFVGMHKTVGPLTYFAQNTQTEDTGLGKGQRVNAGIGINNNGITGDYEYLAISPNFQQALGFNPQVDLKGFKAYTENFQSTNGRMRYYDYGYDYHDFKSYDGSQFYSRGGEYWLGGNLRNPDLFAYIQQTFERFQGNDDRTTTLQLAFPNTDNYNQVAVSISDGVVAGDKFRLESIKATKKFFDKLQLSASYSKIHVQGDNSVQAILTGSYDLGNDRSINGRILRRDNNVNAYVAYNKSGARGVEYYIILGDPNALKTATALVVKVVWPFEIKR